MIFHETKKKYHVQNARLRNTKDFHSSSCICQTTERLGRRLLSSRSTKRATWCRRLTGSGRSSTGSNGAVSAPKTDAPKNRKDEATAPDISHSRARASDLLSPSLAVEKVQTLKMTLTLTLSKAGISASPT